MEEEEAASVGGRLSSVRHLESNTCQEEARAEEEPTSCALIGGG